MEQSFLWYGLLCNTMQYQGGSSAKVCGENLNVRFPISLLASLTLSRKYMGSLWLGRWHDFVSFLFIMINSQQRERCFWDFQNQQFMLHR